MQDESFYDVAVDGAEISIDVDARVILVGEHNFTFTLSQMEEQLISSGGITAAFQRFGKNLFDVMCAAKPRPGQTEKLDLDGDETMGTQTPLEW